MNIDAVITWVDGSDPRLNIKRERYCGFEKELSHEDIGGATRYADVGEIHWLVASINKFAPWIRRIFIVTDGQDPCVESRIPVEIVDHTVLFRGYEKYLPSFNSLGIETMLWRIPGLVPKFIYFNDDLLLLKPVKETDFFIDGTPICYGPSKPLFWIKLLHDLKPRSHGRRKVTVKHSFLNSAAIAGSNRILFLNHTPKPFDKNEMEAIFTERPELLVRNIRSRFRNLEQFRLDELYYLLSKCQVRDYSDVLFYFEPKRKPRYVEKKMEKLRSGNYIFGCFNSLDKAPEKDLALVKDTINYFLERS